MYLRNLSIRTGDKSSPVVAFETTESGGIYTIPATHAAAVPRYVLSLLYPDEAAPTDLIRLSGSRADSAWRAIFVIGQTQFRLSRGFSPGSASFELHDPSGARPWRMVARGVADVRAAIARLIELPSRPTVETLCFALNPLPERLADASEESSNGQSGMSMEVQSNEDFTTMLSDDVTIVDPMTEEEIARVSLAYRNARTTESGGEQLDSLQEMLDDHIASMNRLVDSDGTLSRISSQLSRNPPLRELTAAEKEALSTSPERLDEMRVRLVTARTEEAAVTAPGRNNLIGAAAMCAVGFIGALVWTISAVKARDFHLLPANLFPLTLGLFGGLRWIGLAERSSLQGRKGEAAARRVHRLETELDALTRNRDAVMKELGVDSLDAYSQHQKRAESLKKKEAELVASKSAETSTPEYQKATRVRQRMEGERDERRRTLSRVESTSESAYELERTLSNGGIDPAVALWCPLGPLDEMNSQARRLSQVAHEQGLMPDNVMQDSVKEAWVRLAARMIGRQVGELQLDSDARVLVDGRPAAEGNRSEYWLLLDALRISIFMTVLNGQYISMPRFSLRVHPLRLHDANMAAGTDGVYASVGRKMQFVRIESDS